MAKCYLFLLLLPVVLVIGCGRQSDSTSKVTINLPINHTVASNLSSFSESISILNEESQFGIDYFLPITATGYTSGANDKPINCYMAVISSESNSDKQSNYCGKRNATSNLIDSTYTFGAYVGLKASGESIEMDVPPGDNKKIILFGTHAVDLSSCKDLSLNPGKSNFSKMHVVGTSTPFNLKAGSITEVLVQLQLPTASNQVDDCILNNDSNSFVPATHITIERNSFPYQLYRKPISVGYKCEPLDVVLKSNQNTNKTAASSSALQLSLYENVLSSPALRGIFESYSDCAGNVVSAASTFVLPANYSNKRVWLKLTSSDPASTDYSVSASGNVVTPIAKHFNISPIGTEFSAYAETPLQIKVGECVPIKIGYRHLNGSIDTGVASASSMDITLSGISAEDNSSVVVDFYYSDSTCTTAAQNIFNLSASNFFTASGVYMRVPPTVSTATKSFNLSLIKSAGPQTVYTAKYNIKINRNVAANPKISNINFIYKDVFAKNICIPLTLMFVDQKGDLLNITSGDKLNIITSESSYNEISIHDNDPACTGGSDVASLVPANELTMGGGSSIRKLYLFANGSATDYGDKYITIVYNGYLKKKIKFTLTDPAF